MSIWTRLLVPTIGLVMGQVGAGQDNKDLNYSDRMLTPFSGTNVRPTLTPSRSHFPIRVVVLKGSSYYSEDRFESVKSAFSAWSEATKSVPGGGVTIEVVSAYSPQNADVLVWIGTRSQAGGYEGLTREFGKFAVISLAAMTEGKSVSLPKLTRVAMHEFGHALGIWGHSPDPSDIMSLNENTSTVSQADVNTLVFAYTKRSSTKRKP